MSSTHIKESDNRQGIEMKIYDKDITLYGDFWCEYGNVETIEVDIKFIMKLREFLNDPKWLSKIAPPSGGYSQLGAKSIFRDGWLQ